MLRQTAFPVEAPEVVDQVLRTSDGEGGHQHVAAIAMGLLQDAGQLLDRVFVAAVVAVAIGGLHEHHVSFLEHGRRMHQRRAVVAQVAREDHAPCSAMVVHIQLHD